MCRAVGRGGGRGLLGFGAQRGGTLGRWPALPSRPPSSHWAQSCHLGLLPQSPCSPRRRCHVVRHRRGGGGVWQALRAAARVSGKWSDVSGSVGPPCRARPRALCRRCTDTACASVASAVSSTGDGACPPDARTAGGAGERSGSEGLGLPGGCPVRPVRSPPPVWPGVRGPTCSASGHCRQVGCYLRLPLLWGLGLRRRCVPRAVAPMAEGGAQGPGGPVIGLHVPDAEHRSPFQESRPCPPRSGIPAQITARRTLSWSSRAAPPPLGVLPAFPRPCGGARHRKAGSSVPWWSPRWPSSATYTPSSPGGWPLPLEDRGSRPSPGPSCPWPPLPPVPAPPAAPAPVAAGAAAIGAGSARDSRAAGAGPCGASQCGRGSRLVGRPGGGGVAGDQVPHVGVNVVDGLVVVVGVLRRHLLDTGGDAPHRPDVRLRGRPLPLSCALPYPPRPCAPSCLPSGARVMISLLAPGPPPYPESLVLERSLLCPLARVPSCLPLAPVPLPFPLAPASFPCPCLCPLPCPVSLRPLPAPWRALCACPPPLLLALAPCPRPCPLSSLRALWPAPCVRSLALPLAPASFPCPCPCLLLCPESLRLRPAPSPPRVPVLPRCCWPWCPACAPAPSHRCVGSGRALASDPWRSLCRLPPIAQRPRGWQPDPPDRRLLPAGPRAGRIAAAEDAAA